VIDVHDVRTRSSGLYRFIQLHLELDPEISLRRAHVISDEVEMELRQAFPATDVIIHQDPAGVEEQRDSFEDDRSHRDV
jgi:ferrous-iron efflux pump FieF